MMNRALILKSFFPELKISGDSHCKDVTDLKKALDQFKRKTSASFVNQSQNNKKEAEFSEKNKIIHLDCGLGGTVFRFLMAHVCRRPGTYFLKAHPALLKRPHKALLKCLEQLEIQWKLIENQGVYLKSSGWILSKPVTLDLSQSSQYATAILLNCWNLPKPLTLKLKQDHYISPDHLKHSSSYLKMTLSILKKMGLEIHNSSKELLIPEKQKIKKTVFHTEPDMDSAFALSALAVTAGSLKLESFPEYSDQPSFIFLEILKKMGVNINHDSKKNLLHVKKTSEITGIEWDLSNCPDLFPVLAILLSRAIGESNLYGLDFLPYKESNRLEKVSELLTKLNFKIEKSKNSMKIHGESRHQYPELFDFDPSQDHRMVMAGALAQFQGAKINILNSHVVSKSFPEFLEIIKSK